VSGDPVIMARLMNRRARAIALLMLLPLVALSWSCQGREDKKAPRAATPGASTTAVTPSIATMPTASPPPVGAVTTPPAPAVGPGSSDCCGVVANPERKGRLGRLIVKFPEGAYPGNTRVDVFRPGEQTSLAGGYGGQMLD